MTGAIILAVSYLLGSIPFGYLLVRWAVGVDIRTVGSGNVGAANVARQTGWLTGISVLLLDAGKGAAAVWLAGKLVPGSLEWGCAAALAAMAGHVFPVFLRFRGGKAVATFFGAFAVVAPLPTAAAAIVWVATTAGTRHTSAGSGMAAATYPLGLWLIAHPPVVVIAAACVAAILILWRHLENFRRIRTGTEARIRLGGGPRRRPN